MVSASQWIRYFGREKLEDTKGEVAWDGFAESHEIPSEKVEAFMVPDSERPLKPDRYAKRYGFIEVDGVVHDTPLQQSKTRWRDEAITQWTGKPIVHVPDELLVDERWHDYVALRLWLFLRSGSTVCRIPL